MKNLASNIVYNDVNHQYEFFVSASGIDFGDRTLPITKRIPKKIYDEIDEIKKAKLRRMPNPFKDNTQRIC